MCQTLLSAMTADRDKLSSTLEQCRMKNNLSHIIDAVILLKYCDLQLNA